MTSPKTLYMKNAINEYILTLVTHMAYFDTRFGRYDFFLNRVKVLIYFGQLGHWNEISALGPTMSESRQGLIMDSVAAYLPSSSMPTQTHDFGTQSKGYGRSKTALMRS
jgi:hypothetical protein